VFRLCEDAPRERRDAERREVIRSDLFALKLFWLLAARQVGDERLAGAQGLEGLTLLFPVAVIERRGTDAGRRKLGTGFESKHQAGRVFERQRFEQHAIDGAE